MHEDEMASLVAQTVKNLPVMQETQVRFLGWEDLLEKKLAIHSSILALRILWPEEAGRLVHGVVTVGHYLKTKPPLGIDGPQSHRGPLLSMHNC